MYEKEIYNYITINHVGKDNLIKNKELRALFPMVKNDKSMRKIIQNIRESREYDILIGSISGKSGGFFACSNEEEIKGTINNVKHRANQMLRATHIMQWKAGIMMARRKEDIEDEIRALEQQIVLIEFKDRLSNDDWELIRELKANVTLLKNQLEDYDSELSRDI